jgi:hypothetical protein
MKNQNPQDILNEILLCMRYDSSKTLSENKEIILEQGGSYYTPSGKLIGYPGVNNVNIPASDVYPEIKNNQYPQTADFNKIQTALAGRNIRNVIQQKPSGIQTRQEADVQKSKQSLPQNFGKPREGAVSPYNYTPYHYPSYRKNEELADYTSWYNNYTDVAPWQKNFVELDKPKTNEEVKAFQDFLDEKYPTWYKNGKLNKGQGYGTFGPSTSKKWYENENIRANWFNSKKNYLSQNTSQNTKLNSPNFTKPNISYKDETNLVIPKRYSDEEMKANLEFSKKAALKQKRVEINTASGKLEVPGDTKLQYWTYDDVSSFGKFKRNILDKDNSAFSLYTSKPPFFGTSIVKSFTIPTRKGVDITFKQVVDNRDYSGFGALDGDGYLVYYDKWSFFNKTDWEDLGPTLLNVGSIVLALFPQTWPLLLLSAGMDLYAAKMQYEQGETEGAKISALLALTPFIGKLGIKVSPSASKNLINKFANAVTSDDVNNVVLTLSKEELSTLKSLRELGNLKSEVKALAASKEVKDAINTSAKNAPGLGKTAIKKGALELSLAGSVLYTQWGNLKEEILAEMTNKQLIEQYIVYLQKLTTDQETIDKLNEANKLMVGNTTKFVGDLLEKIIKEAEKTKKLQTEGINEEIEKMNQYLQTSTEPINSKIGLEKSKTLIDTVNTLGNNIPNIPNELNKPK